jgi:hypothetical protein
MNAKHKNEDWAFIVKEVDKISLAEPSGLIKFMKVMAEVEVFDLDILKLQREPVQRKFPSHPLEYEPGLSKATSSTPSCKSNSSSAKKD